MKSWRDRLGASDYTELSAEGMATLRIMKGMGAAVKDIGKLCSRFGIDYNEEESSFQRAVKILHEVYPDTNSLDFIDVKTGKNETSIFTDLFEDPRTGIIFYRIAGKPGMTAFIKGMGFRYSQLGQKIIQPGIKYLACSDGMEIWEQEPIRLIKSFAGQKQE